MLFKFLKLNKNCRSYYNLNKRNLYENGYARKWTKKKMNTTASPLLSTSYDKFKILVSHTHYVVSEVLRRINKKI